MDVDRLSVLLALCTLEKFLSVVAPNENRKINRRWIASRRTNNRKQSSTLSTKATVHTQRSSVIVSKKLIAKHRQISLLLCRCVALLLNHLIDYLMVYLFDGNGNRMETKTPLNTFEPEVRGTHRSPELKRWPRYGNRIFYTLDIIDFLRSGLGCCCTCADPYSRRTSTLAQLQRKNVFQRNAPTHTSVWLLRTIEKPRKMNILGGSI